MYTKTFFVHTYYVTAIAKKELVSRLSKLFYNRRCINVKLISSNINELHICMLTYENVSVQTEVDKQILRNKKKSLTYGVYFFLEKKI